MTARFIIADVFDGLAGIERIGPFLFEEVDA